jgi:hypothetical protein
VERGVRASKVGLQEVIVGESLSWYGWGADDVWWGRDWRHLIRFWVKLTMSLFAVTVFHAF